MAIENRMVGAGSSDACVAGYVYDVTDGQVREIFAPASLREGA